MHNFKYVLGLGLYFYFNSFLNDDYINKLYKINTSPFIRVLLDNYVNLLN